MNKFITLGQLVSVVTKILAVFTKAVKKLETSLTDKVSDAPDEKLYLRKKNAWVEQKAPAEVEAATDKEVEEALDKILNTEKS